jgi:hypothetical protein
VPGGPADLLADIGRALHGEHWRAPIARRIGKDDETVRRYMSGHTRLTMEYDFWPGLLEDLRARAREIARLEAALLRAMKLEGATK